MSSLISEIQRRLQYAVSGDKYRYREGGWDLDLTYITPRIIAMGIPGEGASANWRNDVKEVARFFETKHKGHFLIVNVSGEKYNYNLFEGKVVEYAFPDHHPPPLGVYMAILKEMHEWLVRDPANICAVHCLAGRSRTGTIVSGYLLYASFSENALSAISYFNSKRSLEAKDVCLPSQIRYVGYLDALLRDHDRLALKSPTPRTLRAVIIKPPLRLEGSVSKATAFFKPFLTLKYQALPQDVIFNKAYPSVSMNMGEARLEVPSIPLYGDILLKISHVASNPLTYGRVCMKVQKVHEAATSLDADLIVDVARISFHTSFLEGTSVTFHNFEIDAHKAGPIATDNKYIPSDLTITLELDPPSTTPDSHAAALNSSLLPIFVDPTSQFNARRGTSSDSSPAISKPSHQSSPNLSISQPNSRASPQPNLADPKMNAEDPYTKPSFKGVNTRVKVLPSPPQSRHHSSESIPSLSHSPHSSQSPGMNASRSPSPQLLQPPSASSSSSPHNNVRPRGKSDPPIPVGGVKLASGFVVYPHDALLPSIPPSELSPRASSPHLAIPASSPSWHIRSDPGKGGVNHGVSPKSSGGNQNSIGGNQNSFGGNQNSFGGNPNPYGRSSSPAKGPLVDGAVAGLQGIQIHEGEIDAITEFKREQAAQKQAALAAHALQAPSQNIYIPNSQGGISIYKVPASHTPSTGYPPGYSEGKGVSQAGNQPNKAVTPSGFPPGYTASPSRRRPASFHYGSPPNLNPYPVPHSTDSNGSNPYPPSTNPYAPPNQSSYPPSQVDSNPYQTPTAPPSGWPPGYTPPSSSPYPPPSSSSSSNPYAPNPYTSAPPNPYTAAPPNPYASAPPNPYTHNPYMPPPPY